MLSREEDSGGVEDEAEGGWIGECGGVNGEEGGLLQYIVKQTHIINLLIIKDISKKKSPLFTGDKGGVEKGEDGGESSSD